jgi:hypothetical protein
MTFRTIALWVASALGVLTLPLQAHHSYAATYDVSKEFTIKGKLVEVTLRSPHSFFFIEVKDANGIAQRYAIESAAAIKFSKVKFEVGDEVEVLANPPRTGNFRGRMIKITRTSDGASWGGRPGETVD